MAQKSFHQKLLKNTEFAWEINSLFQVDAVTGAPPLTVKDMIRETIIKTENEKTTVPSGLVPEM